MSDFKTRDVVKEGARFGGWTILLGVIALVVIVVLSAMAIFGFGLFQRETADFRGKTKQIERVKADPDYRIANYDHFFNLCASVQNKEATVTALQAELDTDPPASRVTQINANITALTAQRAASINQYNADAAKEDTQANFLASSLPYRLDPNAKETTCAA